MINTNFTRTCRALVFALCSVFIIQVFCLILIQNLLPSFLYHPAFVYTITSISTFCGSLPVFFLSTKFGNTHTEVSDPISAPIMRISPLHIILLLLMCPGIIYGLSFSLPSDNPPDSSLLPYIFILGCIIIPFGEELLFRKLLLSQLYDLAPSTAICFSALVFALFHMNFSQLFYSFGSGLLFAYAFHITGRLTIPVLLHSFTNLCSSILFPQLFAFMYRAFPTSFRMLSICLIMILIICSIGCWCIFRSSKALSPIPEFGEKTSVSLTNIWLLLFIGLCSIAMILIMILN